MLTCFQTLSAIQSEQRGTGNRGHSGAVVK
jgi:hypothetical protein